MDLENKCMQAIVLSQIIKTEYLLSSITGRAIINTNHSMKNIVEIQSIKTANYSFGFATLATITEITKYIQYQI